MPDYTRLRQMVSHRVSFDYDTGAKVVGYVSECKPGEGPVLVVVLSKVHVYGDDGSVLEKHEAFSLVPNALVNVRIAEGPRDRP